MAVLAVLSVGLVACAPQQQTDDASAVAPAAEEAFSLSLPEGAEAAAEKIDAEYMVQVIRQLSDDAFEGRAPGSQGDKMARKYIAAELLAAGLEPGGVDGGWEQPFDIVGIDAEVPKTWTFAADGGELELAWWDEFIAASGVQQETAAVEDAEVVFVGYGIEAPEFGWDDFKGADLEGKVLLMMNNDPDWDPELFAGERRLYYGRWTYKYESAARQGAVAAIIIHTAPSAGYPWQVVQTSWTGEQFELPAGDEPRLQIAAWTSWEASEQLVQLAGRDLNELVEAAKKPDFQPVPLGVTTSLTLSNTIEQGASTANVAGLLRGGEKADEVVIYTAHHDHLGRGTANADGDDIYNGARDNASGVAQVVALARAFEALPEPPARSILFLLVAAEEQGLLGSKYYAEHPTFPAGKIAANINFDAGNIWGRTEDLIYIGYGKSSLDRVAEAVAARQDRYVVGDQFPDRGYFYRSDQFNFAKIGVPAMYLDGGSRLRGLPEDEAERLIDEWTNTHYHQPSDEYDESWNLEGMIEDTRVGFFAGLSIAEAETMPSWNPGDEFEAARQAALAAAASP